MEGKEEINAKEKKMQVIQVICPYSREEEELIEVQISEIVGKSKKHQSDNSANWKISSVA